MRSMKRKDGYPMEYILETRDLTKTYGKKNAVSNLNLRINQGDIYGFIGRNGAGKSTALKMICNLAKPTQGEVLFKGKSRKEMSDLKGRIGCLIETPGLLYNMTAYENLRAKCIYMGIKDKDYIGRLLEIVNLTDTGNKTAKNFSLGMKQRLGIALALVGDPDVLLLDEPINGLDPQGIAEIRELILKLNREENITIMVSSHILEELSKVATRYGIIHNGELIKELSHEELTEQCSECILLETADSNTAMPVLDRLGFSKYTAVDSKTIEIYERLDEIPVLASSLASEGIPISGISKKSESVEDYFLRLTSN